MRTGQIDVNDGGESADVLTMRGEHDLSTSEELRAAFRACFDRDRPVVVDMTAVDFIDSSIVAALVDCGKPDNTDDPPVALCIPPGASASVRRVVELTGLANYMTVRESLDDAFGAIAEDGDE